MLWLPYPQREIEQFQAAVWHGPVSHEGGDFAPAVERANLDTPQLDDLNRGSKIP